MREALLRAEGAEDPAQDAVIEVLWENRIALEVFLACATQWRIGPMGGYLGLDYGGARAAMAMLKRKESRALFWRLRTLESAAMAVLNERNGK